MEMLRTPQLPEEEYRARKAAERKEMDEILDSIRKSDDPRVKYAWRRTCVDFKDMLETSAELYGDSPLFMQKFKRNQPFQTITYKQTLDDVNALGTALIDIGLKDKHIGVIGKNCYQWAETYLAVAGGVGVIVPLDKELHEDELRQLTIKGELSAVVTTDNKYYNMFKNIKATGESQLEYVINIAMDEDEDKKNGLISWVKLRESGRKMLEFGDRRFLDAQIINTDLAVILFTSGTTGVSKGVMLSTKNVLSNVMLASSMIEVKEHGDIFFSFLPIHHTYECTCTFLESIYCGAAMAFCQGLKHLLKDVEEVRPTILLAVPVVYENFYNKIMRNVRSQGKEKTLMTLLKINDKTKKIGINVSKKATKQIVDTFGGRMRIMVAGGAAIDSSILDFFNQLGFNAIQGYGLTETAPLVALNPQMRKFNKTNSAGMVFAGCEAKVVDQDENGIGELCFKGPNIMMGYYKDPENTAAVMEGEWFHTGDLGYIDEDNYVFITGRKKNVIITGNGKNVFPEELEFYLMKSDFIEECLVWGDETNEDPLKRGIYATVIASEDALKDKFGDDYNDGQVLELIQREVDKANDNLPLFKKMTHVIVRKRPFDKTTAMKIRRHVEDNKWA